MEGQNLRGQSRNKETVEFWQGKWAVNARKNSSLIERDFRKANMEKWGYPDGLSMERIPRRIGRAGIIIAGGASLNWIAPHLKELQTLGMDIICGVSTLSVCAYHNVVPLMAVAMDSNAVVWKEQIEEWEPWLKKHQVPLATTPTVDPGLAQKWPGPRWWFLPEQIGVPIFDAMIFMYPEITCRLMNAGCVANTQLELSDLLGHQIVFTAGVDFGFTNRMYGATLYNADGGSWERHHYLLWHQPLRYTKSGVYTTEEMLTYRTNFHLVTRMNFTQVMRLTQQDQEPGILHGFAKVNVEDILERGWEETAKPYLLSEEQIADRAAKYLKEQQLVLAMGDRGPQLVHFDTEDPTLIPTMKTAVEEWKAAVPKKEPVPQKEAPQVQALQPQALQVQSAPTMVVKMSPEKLQELLDSGTAIKHGTGIQQNPQYQLDSKGVLQLPQSPMEKAQQSGALSEVQETPGRSDRAKEST